MSGRQTQPSAVDRERRLRERKTLHGKQTDLSACFPIGLVNLHRHSAAFTSQDGEQFSDAWITQLRLPRKEMGCHLLCLCKKCLCVGVCVCVCTVQVTVYNSRNAYLCKLGVESYDLLYHHF